ncbi:MAG TPA: MFS transporter [Acidimicrobiales bacterium]|nr:MFS transporter [Acidimicrobiales bacterium]
MIRTELASSRQALRDVFANRALRHVFLAFAGSLIGDGVFSLSAIVYVYRAGGPTAVGVLAVVRYVAIASAAPFTSTFADQFNRKAVMVTSDVVRLALVSVAAVLVGAHASHWFIYALIVLVGVAGTAFRPAQASILPQLAREHDEVAGANVVSSTIESVGFFAGPALAGFLLAVANVTTAFAFDAVTFVWSALLVVTLQFTAPEERSAEITELLAKSEAGNDRAQSFLQRAIAGFQTIREDRDLLILVILYVLQCVVAGASAVFTVAIALRLLQIGSAGLGLMESMLGIGGLIGGFVALVLVQRARLARDFGLGVVVWAAPLLIIAAYPHLWAALIMMWLIGAANSVVDVNAITVLQHVVPNEKLGRVMGALEAGEIGGMAIGALTMTFFINGIGLRWGLTIIGAAVSLFVLPGLPAMRRIDAKAFPKGVEHHPNEIRHRRVIHHDELRAHLHRHLRTRNGRLGG